MIKQVLAKKFDNLRNRIATECSRTYLTFRLSLYVWSSPQPMCLVVGQSGSRGTRGCYYNYKVLHILDLFQLPTCESEFKVNKHHTLLSHWLCPVLGVQVPSLILILKSDLQFFESSESGHRNLVSLMFCYLIDHDQRSCILSLVLDKVLRQSPEVKAKG